MKKLGIVYGGGPAPGINSVIRAVVIEARNRNLEVIGFLDGFSHLSKKEIVYKNLEIDDVSRIHHYGGSIIGTSRGNSSDEEVFNTYLSLINKDKKIKFAHIPKTIDNDFPLPPSSRTFGFETARNLGMELVLNLIEDAKILKRWFFVQVMGRSSGATLTIIPEEFQDYEKIPLRLLLDILEGSIIKLLAYNKSYGVAILAEGLSLKLENLNLQNYHSISEFPLAELLANEIENRLKKRNINIRIISQNIGCVLRNAHPTITLGYGAVKFLLSDNNIHFIENNKVKIRSAYHYIIRLKKEDFENEEFLLKLCDVAKMEKEEFIKNFKWTTEFPPI